MSTQEETSKELLNKILDLKPKAQRVQGKVKEIGEPETVSTRFGESYRIPIVVEVDDMPVTVGLFVREKALNQGYIHPRSNLYKLLTAYNVSSLRELIGKTIRLTLDQRGFYQILTS